MKIPEYDDADATEMAKWVAAGEVSPRELAEAALERIAARNPAVNAVVHLDSQRALDATDTLPDGPFRGVPFLLKDLMAEDAGQPSTSSCAALATFKAPADAELVRRFKAAGLNILGRTNTPEFGIYGVTESVFRGPCRNPFNSDHTPGGSSGGSGSAVASRMVPCAHAGDGGGSIRIPASNCGLFGLKPTRARNPIGPFIGEGWGGLVAEHVVCRSVRDSAALLDATQGPEEGAPYQVRAPERPYVEELTRPVGSLRIAFTSTPLFGGVTAAPNKAAVEHAASLCEARGHTVVEQWLDLPPEPLVAAYLAMVAVGTAGKIQLVGERLGRAVRPGDVEPASWLLGRIGHKLSAAELAGHRAAMFGAARQLATFFADVDVLLTPTCAVPPLRVGALASSKLELAQMRLLRLVDSGALYRVALAEMSSNALAATPNTMLFNLTGQPAASLPLFVHEGLPIGVQAVGRFGDEATLFRLAHQLESEFSSLKPVLA